MNFIEEVSLSFGDMGRYTRVFAIQYSGWLATYQILF